MSGERCVATWKGKGSDRVYPCIYDETDPIHHGHRGFYSHPFTPAPEAGSDDATGHKSPGPKGVSRESDLAHPPGSLGLRNERGSPPTSPPMKPGETPAEDPAPPERGCEHGPRNIYVGNIWQIIAEWCLTHRRPYDSCLLSRVEGERDHEREQHTQVSLALIDHARQLGQAEKRIAVLEGNLGDALDAVVTCLPFIHGGGYEVGGQLAAEHRVGNRIRDLLDKYDEMRTGPKARASAALPKREAVGKPSSGCGHQEHSQCREAGCNDGGDDGP